jgi:hypothetical protein
VTGINGPSGIAVSGSNIFVTTQAGNIAEYTTSGALVNGMLVTGLNGAAGIAVVGSDIFVVNAGSGTIGQYSTSGAVENAALITGLSNPDGIGIATEQTIPDPPSDPTPTPTPDPSPTSTQLAFGQQPSDAPAHGIVTPAITVIVQDSGGSTVTTDASGVTLSIASGPDGATLGGTTTAAAQAGVATFNNLSLSTPGMYTLTASDGPLTSATSTSFNVTASVGDPPGVSPLAPTLGNVKLPASAIPGAKLKAKVPVVVTNQGSTIKGKVTVNLYADAATTFDGSQVLIDSSDKTFSLKAGKRHGFNFNIKSLPTTLGDGTYHLLAEVIDPTGATDVAATTQTIQLAAAFIQPAVTVSAFVPATVHAGKFASAIVTVTNNGNEPAAGIDITLAPSSDGATPLPDLVLKALHSGGRIQPGKSKTFKLHFKIPTTLTAASYFPFVTATLGAVSVTGIGTMAFTVE